MVPTNVFLTYLLPRGGTRSHAICAVLKQTDDDWEGALSTKRIPLEVLPPDREEFTRRVASALKQGDDCFNLKLVCMSDKDNPFRSLRLTTYEPEDEYPDHWISVPIERKQMEAIVEFLAAEGYLYDAFTRTHPPNGLQAPCYFLNVSLGRESEPSRYVDLPWIDLGWDLETVRRLQDLRDVLKGTAAEGIDKLLAALEPQRKLWEEGDAGASAAPSTIADTGEHDERSRVGFRDRSRPRPRRRHSRQGQ